VLRIRDVYPDPIFCPSRILKFFKNLTILTQKILNEGNEIHNFISSSGSGTVINYGSGSDFLTSYGSGSTRKKVTVPTVPVPDPVPQHCSQVIKFNVFYCIDCFSVGFWLGVGAVLGYASHGEEEAERQVIHLFLTQMSVVRIRGSKSSSRSIPKCHRSTTLRI
jgi:hypothetical protein